MSSRGQKRQRSPGDIARPDPPPPPPPSLVKLIKKDAKVLAYFQALQANLDFDVKKWKTRARALEQDLDILRSENQIRDRHDNSHRQLSVTDNQQTDKALSATGTDISQAPRVQGDNYVEQSRSFPVSSHNQPSTEQKRKPTDDFDLDFSSSSSKDEEDTQEHEEQDSPPQTDKPRQSSFGIHKKNTSLNLSSSSDEEDTPDFDRDNLSTIEHASRSQGQDSEIAPEIKRALYHLSTVSTIMKELGIPLVDQETPSFRQETSVTQTPPIANANDQEEQDPPNTSSNTAHRQYILRRRPDRDVAVDILQFIKMLTRIRHVSDPTKAKTQQSYYYPFMTNNCLPCFIPLVHSSTHEPDPISPCLIQHPAVAGVQKLIQSLCYMDVFCPVLDNLKCSTAGITESMVLQQSTNCPGSSSQQRLLLEMRGRQTLISCLLQSLTGEIIETWAINDRTTRLVTKGTHANLGMEPPHVDSESDEDPDQGSVAMPISAAEVSGCGTIPFNSKNFLRLAALAERCILIKMVTSLYLFRDDYHKAFHVVHGYVISTAPSMQLEEHPKLPPVLSFCVLEAILTSSPPVKPTSHRNSTGHWWETCEVGATQKWQEALNLVLQTTAQTYYDRNSSNMDDRITDISRVELAAFSRIIRSKLFSHISIAKDAVTDSTGSTTLPPLDSFLVDETGKAHESAAAMCLALVLHGQATIVDEEFNVALTSIKMTVDDKKIATQYAERLLACTSAKKQLEIRRLDDYRRVVNTPMLVEPNHTGQRQIQSYSKDFVDWIVTQELAATIFLVNVAFRCCQITLDGDGVLRLVEWIQTQLPNLNMHKSTLLPILDTIESMSHALTVRLINLHRRPDRFASFLSQCLHERVNIVRGVANLSSLSETSTEQLSNAFFFGDYAVDGQGKAAQVERHLVSLSGGSQDYLNRLVETHWVPNELKPFDSEAPDSDRRVLITPSEKACAISHIACWKGVERSLSVVFDDASTGPILVQPLGMRQRFLVSGYARGKSLFGTEMEPAPVSVILEDDAILVDRFSDRLENLLEELPRDFHFCSLGYSRPKTAPLVPYSSEISIPTSIWYLTGYILSLEGARFLLNKLPVRGPVDSWIGLAIFSNNWDNVYGHALGVGVSSKPPQDPILSKDALRKILRFRAFAATVPLCSQKVGNLSHVPSTGRNWRHRDTDIVYSGNSLS